MNKFIFASIVCALFAVGGSVLPCSLSHAVLFGVSLCGFLVTLLAIPFCKDKFTQVGISGKDINKINRSAPNYAELKAQAPDVPESQGFIVGAVYICCVVFCQPFLKDMMGPLFAGVLSISMALMIGFGDDVLDIRWRWKIILSAFSVAPLILAYDGTTDLIIPSGIASLLGIPNVWHLGLLYRVCICLIVIFCTNSINMHAGVNGLEVGQSVVISIFIAIYDCIEIVSGRDTGSYHELSLFLVIPFIASSLGLMYHNWYPSAVFVGDSFTYFAGMALSVCGVLGHFTKTLFLFFIPQLINFVLSLPQLFGFIPCPRHRLPNFNIKTNKLEAVWPPHYTLLNLWLKIFGPRTERTLSFEMIVFQVICCSIALGIRYSPLSYLFDGE